MPTDIFDEVAERPVDVFDQIGTHSKGDIFDEIGGKSDFGELQDQLAQPPRTGEERAARDVATAKASGLTTGNVPSERPDLLNAGTELVERGAAQVANIIPNTIDTLGRITGSPKLAMNTWVEPGKPVPGWPLISDAVKHAFKSVITPKDINGIPIAGDHPAAEGISQSVKQAVDSLGTPGGLAMLPALELRVARAIMAGDSLLKTPEQIKQTVAVIQDPNATAEQKWKAIADSGVNLGMTAALGASLRGGHGEAPAEVKPEEKPIEQPSPIVTSNAPTEIPLNPGGAPSDLPPEKLAVSQQNNSPEAFKAVQEQADAAKAAQPTNADFVPKPEMVGMGGAVPAEFEQPETFVSNMFAAIDADRAKMGKPPMPETQTRSWDQDNTTALNRMQRDPEWIPDLIKEVSDKPRPLLSWENAGMVWQRAKWRGEANNALQRVSQAFDDGRTDDLAAARLDAARFEDKLDALDKAVGRNGTGSEAGRSLNAQKMAAGDDFSLIEMRLEKRNSENDGAPLTPKQEAEVEQQFREIEAKKNDLEKHLSETSQRLAESELARMQAESDSGQKIHPKVLEYAENFVRGLETAAEEASKRILERLSRTNAGLDPTLLADLAIVGSAKLARGTLELSKWTTELVAKFGDKIAPHLDEIKKASEAYLDQQLSRQPKPVKERIKKSHDAAQRQVAIKEAIDSRIKDGKRNDISNLVQALARTFVEQGVKGRDALIDAVHGVLKEINPEITRRDTMDAISGYGKFSQLSKDQVSVELRDLKGQMQQVAKLEDIQAKKPLQKTGVERRAQSDEERRLIQQVNEAKRRHGVVVTDPARQLKSSLDAIKTNLRNRISDLEFQIAQGKKTVKGKTTTPLDAEATALKAEKQKLQEQFDAIFGKSELTDAQRVAIAKNALEKSIADYDRRIKEGDLSTKKSLSKTPNTPELQVLKAQRDALREQFQELKNNTPESVTAREQKALEAQKETLEKQIAEQERRLREGDLAPKGSAVNRPDRPELEALKQQRDALSRKIAEARKKPSEQQAAEKLQRQLDAINKRITETTDKVMAGDLSRAPSNQKLNRPMSPELEQAKQNLESGNKRLAEMRKDAAPKKSPEAVSNQSLRTRLTNRIAQLEAKVKSGDFSTKAKRILELEPETQKLKAAFEKAKQDWQDSKFKDKLAKRTLSEKVQDAFVKWGRAAILSSPGVLLKLTAAAGERIGFTPLEEGVGSVAGRILPSIAAKAPREGGGFNVRIEAKAIADAVTKGMADAWQTLTKGKSEIELNYGKHEVMPRTWLDFFGSVHGALKAPAKRAEFSRSFEKRVEHAIKSGVDVADPLVQTRLAMEAYKDAQRAIFLQSNRFADAIKFGINYLDRADPKTGTVPATGKALATIARTLLPIIRVPTNIVAETATYAGGLGMSAYHYRKALKAGIENLHPEQADLILREFKKGTLGSVGLLLGFLAPNMFGGYHEHEEKRKPGDVNPGGARVAGVDVPSMVLHNPLLATIQIGSTVRRVMEREMAKGKGEISASGWGLLAGGIGLIEETPFVREMFEISKLLTPSQREQALADLLSSRLIPQAVRSSASFLDKNENGKQINRKPTNFKERLEMGIPGLRKEVPVNGKKPEKD